MKSNNNNNNDDDDDDDDNNNNTAMGSVQARGDTFLTFGLKALTQTNTSRLATGNYTCVLGFSAPLRYRRT
jgi:methylthioribose-1-phosphate isomerase